MVGYLAGGLEHGFELQLVGGGGGERFGGTAGGEQFERIHGSSFDVMQWWETGRVFFRLLWCKSSLKGC